jgi:hypothetical protein
MHDLGIQQMDVNTFSTSHLRVSPQLDGTVEFRYVDTHIQSRQWSRTVPSEGVIARFEKFLIGSHINLPWNVAASTRGHSADTI